MKHPYFEYIGKIKSHIIYPIKELAPYIEKYQFYENDGITNTVTLKTISNGKVQLFIHYNKSHIYQIVGEKQIRLDNFFAGISHLHNSFVFKPIAKSTCFKGLSVTFSLNGISHLLGFRTKIFTNKIVPFEKVFGENKSYLIDNISKAQNHLKIEAFLNHFFLQLLSEKKKTSPNYLSNIQNIIMEQKSNYNVKFLAKNMNLTSRTIRRIFQENIGIAPKDYLKIIRFNHACHLLSTYPQIDWFEIIYNCGYYDQMHFIHEFKQIMGYSPLKFLKKCDGTFFFERPFIIYKIH